MKEQRIDQELMLKLSKTLQVTPRRVRQIIEERVKDHRYVFSRVAIALDLAASQGIDIRKYASPEYLAELGRLHQTAPPVAVVAPQKVQTSLTRAPTTLSIGTDLKIQCANVPPSILSDAKKMASVYPYLYVFENSVRYLIKDTLESKYGNDWWERKVPEQIRRKAEARRTEEGKNRWHGTRGGHPLFYTDIDELRRIIMSNLPDFKDKLPGIGDPVAWLTNRIQEIELSRNIIAHHNPLSDDDIKRVKMYFKEWVKQLGAIVSSNWT